MNGKRFVKVVMTSVVAVSSLLTLAADKQYVASLQSVDAGGYLHRAELMIKDGNYTGAIDQLRQFFELDDFMKTPQMSADAEFLMAKSFYEQGNSKCLELLQEFISENPDSHYAPEARLLIGDYHFFNKEYSIAYNEYNKADFTVLDSSSVATYRYRKALSMVKIGLFDEARSEFEKLSTDSQYANASRFYLAYLDYAAGDYDKALQGFKSVETVGSSDSFSRSMPAKNRQYIPTGLEAGYYITQIEFRQGKYNDVIEHGRSLLAKSPVTELMPEMNRIIGESYYRLGDENSAWVFLTNYFADETVSHNISACYAMGVIEYNKGNYDEAVGYFTPVSEELTEQGQSSHLYLGQCAMLKGNSSAAAMAFEKAYRMGFDKKVSEAALYNYAVARTEGGRIPFDSSIDILEDFSKTFPKSEYAPIVDEYLATAYYNEKDYAHALQSINRISNPSEKVLTAKQKILYELGVEALSNGNNTQAIEHMTAAANMNRYDKAIATQANLWLGDAYYGLGEYAKAETAYRKFLVSASSSDKNRALAYYDLAYTEYMQNSFAEARKNFKNALNASPALPTKLKTDATTRIADCDYYTGNFSSALTGYASVISSDKASADYATMQHANMQGLLKNNDAKIQELNEMIATYPNSIWVPTAMLEKAQTYIELGNTQAAISSFEILVEKYPQSSDAREGLLQMAIALANSGQTTQAENAYKEVITRWPSSEQAQAANEDLRSIYASRGELDDYARFLRSIPNAPQIDDDQMERLTFEAAENDVTENADDIAKMQKYVEQYPNGKHLASALFYIADSHYSNKRYDDALAVLNELLLKRPDSQYAADALLRKAHIYENSSSKKSQEAVNVYRQLEQRGDAYNIADAYSGIMRNSQFATEQVEYANKLLSLSGLTTEETEEAIFFRAKANLTLGNNDDAVEDFTTLIANVKSEYGSKAAVELGMHYTVTLQFDKAEKILTDFIDEGTPHQYWLARGFIALADNYYAQDNKYVAVEYLKSLKENYPGDEQEIFEMINNRLNEWK